jgi:hypothetical protein
MECKQFISILFYKFKGWEEISKQDTKNSGLSVPQPDIKDIYTQNLPLVLDVLLRKGAKTRTQATYQVGVIVCFLSRWNSV